MKNFIVWILVGVGVLLWWAWFGEGLRRILTWDESEARHDPR